MLVAQNPLFKPRLKSRVFLKLIEMRTSKERVLNQGFCNGDLSQQLLLDLVHFHNEKSKFHFIIQTTEN